VDLFAARVDLALMLEILAGPDPQHVKGGWSLSLVPPTVTTVEELSVAVWADDAYCETDKEYVELILRAARALEAKGATVDYVARPDSSFKESFEIYTQTLGPSMAGQAVDPRMHHRRLKLKKKWESFWDSGFDVLLCPVTTGAALKIDESGGVPGMATRKIVVNGQERGYMENLKWAGLIIIADLPVTVVPIGILPSSGLPVGVQIVAREGTTALRLRSARCSNGSIQSVAQGFHQIFLPHECEHLFMQLVKEKGQLFLTADVVLSRTQPWHVNRRAKAKLRSHCK